jgi:hypothetical protein
MRSMWPRSTKPRLMVIFSLSLGFGRSWYMFSAILMPSIRHLYGWYGDGSSASRGDCSSPNGVWPLPDCRAPTSTFHALLHGIDRTSPNGTHCSATARKLRKHRDYREHRIRIELDAPDVPDASTTVYQAGVASSVENVALTNPPLTAVKSALDEGRTLDQALIALWRKGRLAC